jgi:HlyD family secretion protein
MENRMRKYRVYLTWMSIIFITAGIVLGYQRWQSKNNTPRHRYETVRVDSGRIVAKVTATGTLSSLVTVQVGSQVSGRIQQIMVDFNSPVKKGQIIAKIDPRLFEASVEQARANLFAAQGDLVKVQAQAVDAERQYRRSRALAERQLIAQADVDTSQTNTEVTKAQVEAAVGNVAQAKAALHQAEVNLAYTDIISPTNGVVISRSVDVGQTVAASLQAPILFLIAEDLAKMQVDTSVAEADVGKLQPGMKATFTVDAYPSERFTGTVRQIRNAPQNVQNVVTYDAVIDVANPEFKLKPGMTANVVFIYAEKDETLRVPNAALRFRPPQELLDQQSRRSRAASRDESTPDRRTVWVLRDGGPKLVSIKTGISDGTVTEVLDGDLQAGDQLITDIPGGMSTDRGASPFGMRGGGGLRRVF